MSNRKQSSNPIPKSMQVQLSRLFGSSSKEASQELKTTAEWKDLLEKVLNELYNYLEANIETDEMHFLMLCSCLVASHESLKNDNFWPGYVEGIIRLALILMGDYPDHRRRKGGRKKQDHYKLNLMRTLTYVQDPDQRVRTLFAASRAGVPPLSCNIRDVMWEFRKERGSRASYKEFLRWFREKYPRDYAKMF